MIGSQGESSEASRRLLNRIQEASRGRGEKITILCVHDADLMGHDIYLTLRDGGDEEAVDVVDLGLSMIEAITLGLKPEEAKEEKARRIFDKLMRNLPENELLLLTGLRPRDLEDAKLDTTYRVELNALTPEQFLSWLKKKLAALGILEKVHPPKEVVKAEVREVTGEAVHKLVAEKILRLAGEDLAKFLEFKLCEIAEYAYFDYEGLLDAALAEYPREGWREIVGAKAREKAEKHAKSTWVEDEIRFRLLDRLKQTK